MYVRMHVCMYVCVCVRVCVLCGCEDSRTCTAQLSFKIIPTNCTNAFALRCNEVVFVLVGSTARFTTKNLSRQLHTALTVSSYTCACPHLKSTASIAGASSDDSATEDSPSTEWCVECVGDYWLSPHWRYHHKNGISTHLYHRHWQNSLREELSQLVFRTLSLWMFHSPPLLQRLDARAHSLRVDLRIYPFYQKCFHRFTRRTPLLCVCFRCVCVCVCACVCMCVCCACVSCVYVCRVLKCPWCACVVCVRTWHDA